MNSIKNKIYIYFFVGCDPVGCDPCGRPAPMMFKAIFCLSCCFCICGQARVCPYIFLQRNFYSNKTFKITYMQNLLVFFLFLSALIYLFRGSYKLFQPSDKGCQKGCASCKVTKTSPFDHIKNN